MFSSQNEAQDRRSFAGKYKTLHKLNGSYFESIDCYVEWGFLISLLQSKATGKRGSQALIVPK